MPSYIEIEGLQCDPAQVAAGQDGGAAFSLHNIGDADAQGVTVTCVVNGPGGEVVSQETHDMGAVTAGGYLSSAISVDGSHFNQSGSYTLSVSTPDGGSGSCSFTVG